MDSEDEDVKNIEPNQISGKFQERLRKKGHICNVELKEFDSVQFGVLHNEKLKYTNFKKRIVSLCIVDEENVIAVNFFRSQLALDVEKIRHITKYLYVFHPFSAMVTYWENFMIFVLMINVIYFPLHLLTFHIHDESKFYRTSIIPKLTECFALVDIVLRFNIGYVKKDDNLVCLRKRSIAVKYLTTSFLLDFIAWLPIEYILSLYISPEMLIRVHIFPFFLKTRRFFIFLKYLKNAMVRFSFSLLATRYIILSIWGLYFLHWLNALQFAIVYLVEGDIHTKDPYHISWMSMFELWEADSVTRYTCGLFRIALLVTFQALNMDAARSIEDLIFAIFVWVMSLIFTIAAISIISVTVSGLEYTKRRHHSFQNQLNIYMDRKELSQRLKQKLRLYFLTKYSNSYVSERRMLECMTGGLQQEVTVRSCRRLISRVPFLKFLPDELLTEVVSTMRHQIAMPGEVITCTESLADTIFFILKGTVAVYSQHGYEIMHLHDGDYFGETSMIGGPRFRLMSVVAVSPCELLSLGIASFSATMARNPELLSAMIRNASERMDLIHELDK